MADRIVHLKQRLASALVALLLISALSGCTAQSKECKALAEANSLSSGLFCIEITADSGLALLAYKSTVLDTSNNAEWNGTAIIGAYNMAFQQECRSVYSPQIQAKQWREKWVLTKVTSPKYQLQLWLRMCQQGKGRYSESRISAQSLPFNANTSGAVSVHLPNAPLDWVSICDARIDTMFGTQDLLTSAAKCDVTLYFDANTKVLLGAKFTAESGQAKITGTITASTNGGQTDIDVPDVNTALTDEGLLHEEWNSYMP